MNSASTRADREISHGQWLAEQETEVVWGWGTPAGSLRAQRRADLILAGAAIDANSRVLEIGCGTGFFTEKFAAAGPRIFAVDISPELLAKARSKNLRGEVLGPDLASLRSIYHPNYLPKPGPRTSPRTR